MSDRNRFYWGMICEVCKTSNAPHELVNGTCIKCLQKENTTLRLLVAHAIMAIESGEVIEDQRGKVYRQQFGQPFVDHLKQVVGLLEAVNTQSSEIQKSETGAVTDAQV